MNSISKRAGAIISVAAYATTLIAGMGFAFASGTASADAPKNAGLTYNYDRLLGNPMAQRFYNAFESIVNAGEFKKGEVEYDLIEAGVVNGNDVSGYINNGEAYVPIAYGAGRDAFMMDHPDLFYADVFSTSISAGEMGGNYVAFLDTSRAESLYRGDIDSESEVQSAIGRYETKLNEIVAEANKKQTVKEKIEYANDYLCKNVTYDFCVEVIDGRNVALPEADYVETSYGALVNGKAICGGFARAYKAILDRLDIPCVCVAGYNTSHPKNGTYESHMWNAVMLEGNWYAVDPTWNNTTGDSDKYMLLGELEFSKNHLEDPVVSSSGYELRYPALKPYNYGTDADENGMDIKGEYKDSNGYGSVLSLTVVYDGKGAEKLQEEGKHLIYRYGDLQDDPNEPNYGTIKWGYWFDFAKSNEVYATGHTCDDTKTVFQMSANLQFAQFALVDYAPDESLGATTPDGAPFYYSYNEENLTENHFIVEPSAPYENEGSGTFIPAPGAAGVTPANTGDLNVNGVYEMKFVYNTQLRVAEGHSAEDVGLSVTSSRGNDTLLESIKIENFEWDGDRTITFKFTPSKMFIHNLASYYFTPTNLVGVNSGKIPDPVKYSFKGKSVVCSKVFNDGRLYMSVYGEPTMLDTTDLSISGFKDDKGNYVAEKQRSQLLLVANKPSTEREKEMNDKLVGEETGIKQEDIVTTATYEINLQICGVVQKVPDGSYMQVAFGFPEGFSPDDAGTTFKIYHYTHDDKGNITGVEEIPVIVTEYGLIAKVKSFSPFTVVQVKNTSAAVTANAGAKSVYASATNGGSVSNSGIQTLSGDSIKYDITAESGYQVERVMLNGKPLAAERYADGSVTLTKEELAASNTLEVSFVTAKSAKSYSDRGIEIKRPDTIVVTSADINPVIPDTTPSDGSNVVGIVVGCVIVAVAVAVGAGAVAGVAMKKKRG